MEIMVVVVIIFVIVVGSNFLEKWLVEVGG